MPIEAKSLNEECGLFGIWNQKHAAYLTYDGLHALQHRGQEGAGIVANQNGHLKRHKGLGLLTHVFNKPEYLESLPGKAALGHVRYSTAGSHGIENIQPMMFTGIHAYPFALAHNGNLTNAKTLRKQLTDDGQTFKASSDSEILGKLIENNPKPNFIDRLKDSLNQIRGGFAFILMTPDSMIAALDPNGFRPLVIGKRDDGSTIICSETCALDQVHAKYVRDVEPGEIVIVNDDGIKSEKFTDNTELSVCSMEYIYFSRPDSVIRGVSVSRARHRMGQILAKEQPTPNADVVMAVPNSSFEAAIGYSTASGIPFDMGLVKNQYVARTFIEPTQSEREHGVRMKLSVVRPAVEGKNIVLVDDSIVRGTTSKYIVRLLKANGAKSVNVRIASPVLKFPCFYGIDIRTADELIGAHYSVDGIRKQIESDSLGYLSVNGLTKAIGHLSNNQYNGLCTAYFDGNYPTKLYDYQKEFDEEAKDLGLYKGMKA